MNTPSKKGPATDYYELVDVLLANLSKEELIKKLLNKELEKVAQDNRDLNLSDGEKDFEKVLLDKLPDALEKQQKKDKVKNNLQKLRNDGKINFIDGFWFFNAYHDVSIFPHSLQKLGSFMLCKVHKVSEILVSFLFRVTMI